MAGLVPFNRKNTNLSADGYEDFYNMIEDFFTPKSLERATFKLDVHDTEKEFVIEAELPGVPKDEISLNTNDGVLTISVSRDETKENERKKFLHKERRVTSMSRSIYLKDINAQDVKAKLDNGVLTVTVPKLEKQITDQKIEIE